MLSVNDLVLKYTPVVYLHPWEKYMPVPAEWYIKRSELRTMNDTMLVGKGMVNDAALAEYPSKSKLILTDKKDYDGTDESVLDEVPVYAHYKLLVSSDGVPCCYEINYMYLFAYNAARFGVGGHQGDWEHITVRVDVTNQDLMAVRYNNHKSWEGTWVSAKKVPLSASGQIVAYCALGGHGFWPTTGLQPRVYIVGSDLTSSHGPVWQPKYIMIMDRAVTGAPSRVHGTSPFTESKKIDGNTNEDAQVQVIGEQWLKYAGEWGTSESIPVRGWFRGLVQNTSGNFWKRIFPHC